MRFKNYLLKDKKIQTFRSLQIKLVKNKTKHNDVIAFIEEKYDIDTKTKILLENFNQQLQILYQGTYKFDLCLDEGITPDDLKKIDNKKTKSIKKEWYGVNHEFAKIQKEFEKYLQENMGGK